MKIQVGRAYYLVTDGRLYEEETLTVTKINYPINTDTPMPILVRRHGKLEVEYTEGEIGLPVTVTGITGKTKTEQTFGFMWLQKSPEIMKKKYNRALRYHKKTGNGKIRHLSISHRRDEEKAVMVTYISVSRGITLVHYIDNRGMSGCCNISWFDDIADKDTKKFNRDKYITY